MSLVHAEYLKISRRKLYPVMVAILALLVGLTAFFLLIFGQLAPGLADDVPVLSKPDAYLIGAQQVAGQTWFPLILAVVLTGAELSTTVWATTLTRDSRKPAHIGAQAARHRYRLLGGDAARHPGLGCSRLLRLSR